MSNCTKSIVASTLWCLSSSTRPVISIPISQASCCTSTTSSLSLLYNKNAIHQVRGFRTASRLLSEPTTSASEATLSPPSPPPPLLTSDSTLLGKASDAPPSSKPPRKGPIRTIESMPFQTYQLALAYLREDHEEKLKLMRQERERIAHALSQPGVTKHSQHVVSMMKYLERLNILADINNPRVKYNFENGNYRLNKPIYRYLADRKWREMRRPILMQRLTQMKVIPDVLPLIDPVADVQVRFRGRDVKPGTILNSVLTEQQPTFKVIPFQPGQMKCTVVVIDPDVPDLLNDCFRYRLHWLVSNISISTTQLQAMGRGAEKSDIIVPYLPPHAQKGIPYHRYAMIVFRQNENINPEALKGKIDRDTFNMRSYENISSMYMNRKGR